MKGKSNNKLMSQQIVMVHKIEIKTLMLSLVLITIRFMVIRITIQKIMVSLELIIIKFLVIRIETIHKNLTS